MDKAELVRTAKALVVRGKGILAADESGGTIAKRFADIGVQSTKEARRNYRELLLRADHAIGEYISGAILFDETIRQTAQDGMPLVELIKHKGAIPGIKVDLGAKPLANVPHENITEGLDGLRERLSEYRHLGARFTKWRAIINIDTSKDSPSRYAISANAHALARYAALSQEADLVPIVEPEVLMDGSHDIERCGEVTELVLKIVFMKLFEASVFLEGTVLKPNMVVPGKKCPRQASPEQIASATVTVLRNCVPVAVPGIAFLSGGQSDIEATANLNAINRLGGPWALTFSYGRALQAAAQKAWAGAAENIEAAQAAFAHRAHMNALAAEGRWSHEKEISVA